MVNKLFLLVLLVVLSCKSSNDNKVSSNEDTEISSQVLKDTLAHYQTTNDTASISLNLYESPKKILHYEIVSNSEDDQCVSWDGINSMKFFNVLEMLEPISDMTWNECFGEWGCGSQGRISVDSDEYNFWLDAAGWVMVQDASRSQYFGCPLGSECWSYFPEGSESFCDDRWTISE